MDFAKSFILILLAISIAVAGQTCLKTGMIEVGKIEVNMQTNYIEKARVVATKPIIWFGLFLYGLGAIVWLVVLSRVDLSFAYPMLAMSYILIMIISAFRFGEIISLSRIFGTLLICIGVIFISKS
jgi:drug/metabolite transporter (DMT)-like permease